MESKFRGDPRILEATIQGRKKRESDVVNYPRWIELFPIIQEIARNIDPNIDYKKPVEEILDDMYLEAIKRKEKDNGHIS